jgi:hypothetical protein
VEFPVTLVGTGSPVEAVDVGSRELWRNLTSDGAVMADPPGW